MSSQPKHPEFDRGLAAPAPSTRFPRLALRRRSAENPMALFVVAAASAFISMALLPEGGPALASIAQQPTRVMDGAATTHKGHRLVPTEADIACRDQAWGAESADCALVMAKDAGRKDLRAVRLIANATPSATGPNIF